MRRLIVILAASGLGAAVLAGLALLLLPRFLDLEAVQRAVLSEISRRLRGSVQAAKIDVSLTPLPSVRFRTVRFDAPRITAAADSVTVTLNLRRLLRGEVRPTSIRLDSPRLSVRLPGAKSLAEPVGSEVPSLDERLSRIATRLDASLSGATVSVAGGALELERDGKALSFERLGGHAAVRGESLTLDVSFFSSVTGQASLWVSVDPRRWNGEGRLRFSEFRSETLLLLAQPERHWPLLESSWSGEISVEAHGRERLTASVDAASPLLRVTAGSGILETRDLDVAASAEVSGSRREVSIRRLSLSAPRATASGTLSWDASTGSAAVKASAPGVDLAELRRAALSLAPEAPIVRKVSDIVLEGRATDLSAWAKADRLEGLIRALTVRADVSGAVVHIPRAELTARRASGTVTVSADRLTGERLACVVDATTARNGSLRMALRGSPRAFHLEADLDADLGQVRGLLPRWLRNEAARGELERITGVTGRGTGKLVLGEHLDRLAPTIDVQSFQVAGRYDRVPFPMEWKGSLRVQGNRVAAKGLSGQVGEASLSGISGEATWGKDATLAVESGRASLKLEDFYPWVIGSPSLRTALSHFRRPAGRLDVDVVSLRGLFADFSQWEFEASGQLERSSVESDLYPGPLKVARGAFTVTDNDLSWSGVEASLLDSALVASGRLAGFRSGPIALDLTADGLIGPDTAPWAEARIFARPPVLAAQPVKVSRGHLVWTEAATRFAGDLAFGQGPVLSVDVERARDRLAARQILIRDSSSDARLALSGAKGVWDISFSGRLGGQTSEALFGQRGPRWREVAGEVRAHVVADAPWKSSADGTLRLSDVRLAGGRTPPLAIEDATLAVTGKTLQVQSARIAVGPLVFSAEGQVQARGNAYEAELKASAEEIDLDAVSEALRSGSAESGDQETPGQGMTLERIRQLPIRGSVSVEVGTLRYGNRSWKPVRAKVTLSDGTLAADLDEAELCGVRTGGRVEIGSSNVSAKGRIFSQGAELDDLLTCLWQRGGLATGSFRLFAEGSVSGARTDLVRSSEGSVSFQAKDGRIFRFDLLAKVFAVLNVTELLRGRLPDFEEGVAYDAIEAEGTVREGVLSFEKGLLDGKSVQVFWEGTVDLASREADLTVLVSPFRTVDAIISHIPLLNYVMANRLVAFPVRVTGNLDDPSVIPLEPGAIGSGILGIVSRAIKLPYRLIEPLLPKSDARDYYP